MARTRKRRGSKRLRNFAEQNGWVCALCGGEIPRRFKENSPIMPSMDHVIPRTRLKRGQPGTYQLTHRWCNNIRHDYDPEKLPKGYFDTLEAAQQRFERSKKSEKYEEFDWTDFNLTAR